MNSRYFIQFLKSTAKQSQGIPPKVRKNNEFKIFDIISKITAKIYIYIFYIYVVGVYIKYIFYIYFYIYILYIFLQALICISFHNFEKERRLFEQIYSI